jgi:predicted DNA-binding transcriptional regulator AlpA
MSDGGKKDAARRMLSLEQVLEIVPVARSTLFLMLKDGRFPAGTYITANRVIWFEDEIAEWQARLPSKKPARKQTRKKR